MRTAQKSDFCDMRIVVCAATEMEIAPIVQSLSPAENQPIKTLITGVGLVATAYALAKEFFQQRPDFVLQAGVGGLLDTTFSLGQVVAVRSECIGDLGVKESGGFRSLFDLQLLGTDSIPWEKGRLVNKTPLLYSAGLPVVDGVSINQISTSAEQVHYYQQQLQVQVESMEGAALHYVCLMEKIPFLQIRSLSNFIGERDKGKWKMREAIGNLNHELRQILAKLETT